MPTFQDLNSTSCIASSTVNRKSVLSLFSRVLVQKIQMPQCHCSTGDPKALGFNLHSLMSPHKGEMLPSSQRVTPTSTSPGQPCLSVVSRAGPPTLCPQPIQTRALLSPTPRPLLLGCVLGNGSTAWGFLSLYLLISILQMRKRRLREAKEFAQGHRAKTG